MIQDLHIGEAPDGMGGILTGNGGNGFLAADSTFTGVAFLDSFLNQNGFDGILVETSTIKSGSVTFDDGMPEVLKTGLLIKGSRVIGNGDNGVEFDGVTAHDVTLKGDVIAENGTVTADGLGVGVFIRDTDLNDGSESRFSNFVIEDSDPGHAPDGVGGSFGGNALSGFDANDFELHLRRLCSIVLQRQRHIRRWRWHPVLRRHNRSRAGDALSGRHERAGDHDPASRSGLGKLTGMRRAGSRSTPSRY